MRKSVRVLFLFVAGVLSTAVLGAMTAVMAAVSLAATALIVPGTGTPNATGVLNYMEHARDRYIAPFSTSCNGASCGLVSAEYPASFFPLVIFPGWCEPGRCATWNTSVGEGVESLDGLIRNTTGQVVVFGYSQGGAVVSNELRDIAGDPTLLEKIDDVVLIGNIYNPDGGLFTRLGFLPTIPFLDITFGPKTPVEIPELAGKFTSIGFEYDPVMYAPLYWGNPFAMLNAVAAFETVHGYYLTPDGNNSDPIAYGYQPEEIEAILDVPCGESPNCRPDPHGNEYWMIPAKSLPIFNLILQSVPAPLKPLLQPIVDLLTPVTRVLIDLGYDWSGNPATQRYLSPLPFNPFTNWLQVGADLVEAIGEGINNAVGGGATTMIAPPSSDSNVLAFNARTSGSQQGTPQLPQGSADDNEELGDDGSPGDGDDDLGDNGSPGDDNGSLSELDDSLEADQESQGAESDGTATTGTGTTGATTTGTETTGTPPVTGTTTTTTDTTTTTVTGTTTTTGTDSESSNEGSQAAA